MTLSSLAPLLHFGSDYLGYGLGAVVSGLAGIVLVPLYTRVLGSAGFGAFALLESGIIVAVTIGQSGLNAAYLRWYASCAEDENRGRLLGSTILVQATSALVCSALLAVVADIVLS